MSPAIASLLSTAPGAVTLAVQVTCLFLLALALAWLGRRGSLQTLHLLWTITFGVVLALPVLGVLTPRWNVPILPDADRALHSPAAEAVAVTPQAATIAEGQGSGDPRGGTAGGLAVDGVTRSSPGLARVLLACWVLGCAVSLVSLAFGALRLRRLVNAARPLRDADWLGRADGIRKRLRIRGHVRLLTSGTVLTPMTGGLWRPVILLPESVIEWCPDQRDIVLAHELIHVRRRDALRQVMRRTVLALYWFHPLSWIASRLATLASERACDGAVLALGHRPSEYARHLLVLARGLSRGPAVLALPIVHPSQLESRIVSILERRRPRSAFRAAMTLAVLGAAGVFVAAARPVPVGDAIQESVRCPDATDAAASMFPLGDGMLVEDWRGGERAIERFVEGMHLCMRESGEVVMSADGTTVQALGAESWLVLESRAGSVHRLVITRGSGGIEREWSVDGVRQTFGADARRWRDLMFIVLKGSEDTWQVRSEEARLRNRISDHRGHVAARRGLVEALEGQVARLTRGGTLTERQAELLRGRITELRAEMEAYDLDGKVREVRREIETLDADARAADVESALQDKIAELQRLIG